MLDVGTHSTEPVDYPDYAEAVGAGRRHGQVDRGIIICGSGVGASMAANKIPGIRAGLCHDTYSAHQGVEHDDMNVLVLGGRVVGIELARELIRGQFLARAFTGEERHLRRLAKDRRRCENPCARLQGYGQSVWFDYIRRSLITSGELQRLIDEDGLRGVTSNPAIFEKAIAGSTDYTSRSGARSAAAWTPRRSTSGWRSRTSSTPPTCCVPSTSRPRGATATSVSRCRHLLAHDTEGTIDEARRLWRAVARPNVMIKVPATPRGHARPSSSSSAKASTST